MEKGLTEYGILIRDVHIDTKHVFFSSSVENRSNSYARYPLGRFNDTIRFGRVT